MEVEGNGICRICKSRGSADDFQDGICIPKRSLGGLRLSECWRYAAVPTNLDAPAVQLNQLATYLWKVAASLHDMLDCRMHNIGYYCALNSRIKAMETIGKIVQTDGNFIPFRSKVDTMLAIGYIGCGFYAPTYGQEISDVRSFLWDLSQIIKEHPEDSKLLKEILFPPVEHPDMIPSMMTKFKVSVDNLSTSILPLDLEKNQINEQQHQLLECAIDNVSKNLEVAWGIHAEFEMYQRRTWFIPKYEQLMIRGCRFLEAQLETLALSLKENAAKIWSVPPLGKLVLELKANVVKLNVYREQMLGIRGWKPRGKTNIDDLGSDDDYDDFDGDYNDKSSENRNGRTRDATYRESSTASDSDSEASTDSSRSLSGQILPDLAVRHHHATITFEYATLPETSDGDSNITIVQPSTDVEVEPMDIDDLDASATIVQSAMQATPTTISMNTTISNTVVISAAGITAGRKSDAKVEEEKQQKRRRTPKKPGTKLSRKWCKHIRISSNIVIPPDFRLYCCPPIIRPIAVRLNKRSDYLYPAKRLFHNNFNVAYDDITATFANPSTRFIFIEPDFHQKISSMIWALQETDDAGGVFNLYPRWFYNSYSDWVYPFDVIKRPRRKDQETYRITILPYRHFILSQPVGAESWDIVDYFKDSTQQGNCYRPRGVVLHHGTGLTTTSMSAYWTFRQFKTAFIKTEKSSNGKQTKGRTTARMSARDREANLPRRGRKNEKVKDAGANFDPGNFPFRLKLKHSGFDLVTDEPDLKSISRNLIFGNIATIHFVPTTTTCQQPIPFPGASYKNVSLSPYQAYPVVFYTFYSFPQSLNWMAKLYSNGERVMIYRRTGSRNDALQWSLHNSYSNDCDPKNDRKRRKAKSNLVDLTVGASKSTSEEQLHQCELNISNEDVFETGPLATSSSSSVPPTATKTVERPGNQINGEEEDSSDSDDSSDDMDPTY